MTTGAEQGRLEDLFDSVVFLTQSDWRSEPRSNRYHYARRFAARLPTFFVQPDAPHSAVRLEPTEIDGLNLVHCAWWDEAEDAALAHAPRFRQIEGAASEHRPPTPAEGLRAFLAGQGAHKPLLWIYNPNYRDVLAGWPEAFKVFHATEDYTLAADSGRYFDDAFQTIALDVVRQCDLLVAVSDRVRANYDRAAGLGEAAITLSNGCDYGFWAEREAWRYIQDSAPPSLIGRLTGRAAKPRLRVIYQGGVNDRLDFPLLLALAERMADAEFTFCGPEDARAQTADAMAPWRALKTRPNVRYLGVQTPDAIAEEARRSSVALIPYAPSDLIAVSLPLKAYEYLACGLPVVSTPIPALERDAALFAFARTAADYEAAIRRLATTRDDSEWVARRLAAAAAMDYDRRFEELERAIVSRARGPRQSAAHAEADDGWRVLARYDATALQCQNAWQEAGADIVMVEDGARTTTPHNAWNFAAMLRFDLDEAMADHDVRLTVALAEIDGQARLGVFDENDGGIAYEETLWPTPGRLVHRLEASQLKGRLLLIRNGALDARCSLTFLHAELAVRPRLGER